LPPNLITSKLIIKLEVIFIEVENNAESVGITFLNPDINRNNWTLQEDLDLLEKVLDQG
jgi:hypothetical protein